jgi:pimeloyl-ACP methyl ester carboxylesterase
MWQPVLLKRGLGRGRNMTTYILPGMGADATMYGSAFRTLKDVRYADWPHYDNEKSIKDVALKLIDQYTINSSDIVGGSSLGGIVASEIAKYVELEKIILIGSTLMPDNISPILKKLSLLSEIAPINLIQAFAGKAGLITKNKLLEMFGNANSTFIKAMCKAVFEWDGNPTPHCACYHIHGARDLVIYPPKTGATIIDDGGHLIAITHEEIIADFIKESIIA